MRVWRVRPFVLSCSAALCLLAAGCGGGGSGGDDTSNAQDNPAPIANAGPDQTVSSGATVTLTGAGSTDSGGAVSTYNWTQTQGPGVSLSSASAVSPSFSAPTVTASAVLRFSLGVVDNLGKSSAVADTVDITVDPPAGGGGGGGGGGPVTVSGNVTFARVPFVPLPGTGLDYAATRQDPSRGITIQALNASTSAVLASTVTDGSGNFSLSVPGSTSVVLRAVAQMVRQAPQALPRWNFTVRDVDASSAPYSFTGNSFNSGTANSTQNLAIPSGWNTATRSPDGTRHAAPFAILDTIYRAREAIVAVAPTVDFPVLTLDWAPSNPAGETFYTDDGGGSNRRIVLAGEDDADIDEYDPHTIAHEFGHYIEDRFSRSDSIGGPHSFGQRLDMRLAFGEGFGYAFAAIVLNDPVVRDAAGTDQLAEGRFNVEQNSATNQGWFSESSVEEILWDLYDSGAEANDNVALGLAPLWAVLTGAQRNADAMTSIFPFITALKAEQPAAAALIDQVVSGELIQSASINGFGSTETNNAGSGDVLPIYSSVTVGGSGVTVRSVPTFDPGAEGNKLSSHRFLRLDVGSSQSVRITATTAQARDIDVLVYRNGTITAAGVTPSTENFVTTVSAGTYVLDVYDCGNAACSADTPAPTDITVTVTVN